MSFRSGVTHKAGKVWQYNENKDLYTGWYKGKVLQNAVEVDHIVECQLGEDIWENVMDGRRTTRGRLAPLRELWNSIDNLNNTPLFVNRNKGYAFRRWRAGHEDDLRSALRSYNVASNHTIKICVAFEEAADWIMDELDDLAEETDLDFYSDFACELSDWRDSA